MTFYLCCIQTFRYLKSGCALLRFLQDHFSLCWIHYRNIRLKKPATMRSPHFHLYPVLFSNEDTQFPWQAADFEATKLKSAKLQCCIHVDHKVCKTVESVPTAEASFSAALMTAERFVNAYQKLDCSTNNTMFSGCQDRTQTCLHFVQPLHSSIYCMYREATCLKHTGFLPPTFARPSPRPICWGVEVRLRKVDGPELGPKYSQHEAACKFPHSVPFIWARFRLFTSFQKKT